ncbi:PEP-CTERM sorting domain-containing protein [Alteromonas sp. HB246098]
MKKFFLLLMAAATFNANAALISLTTDKPIYSVGDTVTVTISISGLFNNSVQTLISAYATAFSFDDSVLQFIDNSIESLMPFGTQAIPTFPGGPTFPPELFSGRIEGTALFAESTGALGSTAPQQGQNEISLYRAQFLATSFGNDISPFTFLQNQFIDAVVGPLSPETAMPETASFTIAQVPTPGTFALSLLALGGMFFARKRAKS